MSIGMILTLGVSALGPVALAVACVFEYMAWKMRKNPRASKELLAQRQKASDTGLVAAFGLWALGYIIQSVCPDAAAWELLFQKWMTWIVCILLVLDIPYLIWRRSRPGKPGQKKRFWEI